LTNKHLTIQNGLIPLTVIALAALVSACGSTAGSKTSSSASASANAGANRAALVACLRKHGVNLPAGGAASAGGAPGAGTPPTGSGAAPPAGGAGGTPPSGFPGGGAGGSKLQAAFKACGAKFPSRAQGAGNFSNQTIQRYVTCVRQHGYHLPNPNFSGKGSVFPASVRSNSKFKTASRACQSLLRPTGATNAPTSS
jgi:hypothetical protein